MIRHKCAFSVDVEDGVSIAMRDVFHTASPQTDRVVVNTRKILNLLAHHDTRATFFLLGKVAEDFPFLPKEIAKAGHEIGIHGYHHLQFFRMTPEQAFQELDRAKKLIEDLIGERVLGHRAPAFSINEDTAWALDIIAELGFKYDSSIVPIRSSRYGWPGYPKDIRNIVTERKNELIEAPISTLNIMGKEIPFSGGGYLRLFPFWVTKLGFQAVEKNRPVILYIHPYDLDTERYPDYYFDHLNKVGFVKRAKIKSNWVNRRTVLPKLGKLLEKHSFDTLWNIINTTRPA